MDIKPDTLYIKKIDEVYIAVNAEPVIRQELSDFFTFKVPGAEFMPAVQNKMWDGKIRLFNMLTGTIYAGLLAYIQDFAKNRNYEIIYFNEVTQKENFSYADAEYFLSTLPIKNIKPRDYQIECLAHSVSEKRGLNILPTSAGKSFCIYSLIQYFDQMSTLIIVPTTSLVKQMKGDFLDYGGIEEDEIHEIMAGKDKNTKKRIVVSTWQSIYKQRRDWFSRFGMVIVDEVHLAESKSICGILEKMNITALRFGFTGTLKDAKCHKLTLTGLFGPDRKFISTAEMIERGYASRLHITPIVMSHTKENRKKMAGAKYQDEMQFIAGHAQRNKIIKNLALQLEGNTLILFQYVDKHGKILYDLISNEAEKGRKVFFVHGGTAAEQRELIRSITEKETNAIIVASYGTFSTGINIKRLHNCIFASPYKSVIKILQSIGRILRISDEKSFARLFDIADDLRHGSKMNHTMKHFAERLKIYDREKFPWKIRRIELDE